MGKMKNTIYFIILLILGVSLAQVKIHQAEVGPFHIAVGTPYGTPNHHSYYARGLRSNKNVVPLQKGFPEENTIEILKLDDFEFFMENGTQLLIPDMLGVHHLTNQLFAIAEQFQLFSPNFTLNMPYRMVVTRERWNKKEFWQFSVVNRLPVSYSLWIKFNFYYTVKSKDVFPVSPIHLIMSHFDVSGEEKETVFTNHAKLKKSVTIAPPGLKMHGHQGFKRATLYLQKVNETPKKICDVDSLYMEKDCLFQCGSDCNSFFWKKQTLIGTTPCTTNVTKLEVGDILTIETVYDGTCFMENVMSCVSIHGYDPLLPYGEIAPRETYVDLPDLNLRPNNLPLSVLLSHSAYTNLTKKQIESYANPR